MSGRRSPTCGSCSSSKLVNPQRLGLKLDRYDYVVALAGNPNTGKSSIFNELTGLRQHTGNWPGKTVSRAEGGFSFGDKRFKLVDLPGTYSLLSASEDEEIARDFILFGRPDVTVIVVDATRLERNLNLVLQVLQITDKALLCLNMMDEARAHGLTISTRGLARDLGVPVIRTSARYGEGIEELVKEIDGIARGEITCRPRRLKLAVPGLRGAVEDLTEVLLEVYPDLSQAQWIALRLLEGDLHIIDAVASGEIGRLSGDFSAHAIDEQLQSQPEGE